MRQVLFRTNLFLLLLSSCVLKDVSAAFSTTTNPERQKEKKKWRLGTLRQEKSKAEHQQPYPAKDRKNPRPQRGHRKGNEKKLKKQPPQNFQCKHYISSSRDFLRRRLRRPYHKLAYRMAILAFMAYWDFSKQPLSVSGFRILQGGKRGRGLLRRLRALLCQSRRQSYDMLINLPHNTLYHDQGKAWQSLASCRPTTVSKQDKHFHSFDYWLYNWHEPTVVPKVNWHDTDILISTLGSNRNKKKQALVVAFAGTASTADAMTNIQTFEPVQHSGIFPIEGSLHRGFLNAYSRVERGSVIRLCHNCTSSSDTSAAKREDSSSVLASLHQRFAHCTPEKKKKRKRKNEHVNKSTVTGQQENASTTKSDLGFRTSATSNNITKTAREKRSGGCHHAARGEKLFEILRELVTNALSSGHTVHVTGHSLGGGLATLCALDIIVNFPHVPISKLYLWTFGAPQVANDVFVQSAMEVAPRLRGFVKRGKGHFNRFVTLSDDCQADIVATITERALPGHKRSLRGRAARKLGGVHGTVVHVAPPQYLLTPQQYRRSNTRNTTLTTGPLPNDEEEVDAKPSTTKSTIDAHQLANYLQGISREYDPSYKNHSLLTDLPMQVQEWLLG